MYALVKDGAILAYTEQEPNLDQTLLAPGKPRWLLIVEKGDVEYDTISEIRETPVASIEEDQVTWTYTKRSKDNQEVAAMSDQRIEEIEATFQHLVKQPIGFTVGGEDYYFHADDEAIQNITGCLQAYSEAERMGIDLPDPRTWTPYGSLTPISITRNELAILGLTIAGRVDALFTIKKSKQSEVHAMTDCHEINDYDPTIDWT